MPKYSIVTCVSDFDIYNSCLLASLRHNHKNIDYELIPIDNRSNGYTASSALNLGVSIAKSKLIICCHQDVTILPDFFNHLEANLKKLTRKKWGILGSAGRLLKLDAVSIQGLDVGVVYDGPPANYNEDYQNNLKTSWEGIKTLNKVYSVDECLFIMNKINDIAYDEDLNGFHFYGTDICLNYRRSNYDVYATYLPIIHHGVYSSSLQTNHSYWPLFKRLVNKWLPIYDRCFGTHMHWRRLSDDLVELVSYITTDSISLNFQAKVLYSNITEHKK